MYWLSHGQIRRYDVTTVNLHGTTNLTKTQLKKDQVLSILLSVTAYLKLPENTAFTHGYDIIITKSKRTKS